MRDAPAEHSLIDLGSHDPLVVGLQSLGKGQLNTLVRRKLDRERTENWQHLRGKLPLLDEADDLLRDAENFLALVDTTLGVPHQTALPRVS